MDSLGRTIPPYRPSEAEIESQLNDLRTFRGPDGRAMDPATIAARERELREIRLPFFSPVRGLAYDPAGRLWVVGSANDSVHIDVFADTTFLGRQSIPCGSFTGGWAMASERAAFVCADGDRPVLRMFRVQ